MAKAKKNKVKRKSQSGGKRSLFLAFAVLAGLIFLPTSTLLFFGLLPTLVAFVTSIKRQRSRTSTIAAANLAGCVPFVFKLWTNGNSFEASFDIITEPMNIVVMYGAAFFGYLLDWVVVGAVSSFLYQKAVLRLDAIKKRQQILAEEWGAEVSGDNPLDGQKGMDA